MFERSEPVLKLVCLCLAGLVAYEVARLAIRRDPLAQVRIPALPTLADATNAPAGGKGTNALPAQAAKPGTNVPDAVARGTNASAILVAAKTGTNSPAIEAAGKTGTNLPPAEASQKGGTNLAEGAGAGKSGTNLAMNAASTNATTNAAIAQNAGRLPPGFPPRLAGGPGRMPMIGPMGPMGMKGPELPPAIKTRVEKITDSELLAPVIRPQPMALLGIAGPQIFFRAPNGQTGLLKEGEELGGVKLLRIGTNRVLVEENQEKKELTIFSGFGGESLLPK